MKKKEGETLLAALFEASDWKEKYLDRTPPDVDGVVYKWSSEDAEYAAPFFSKAGRSVLMEETCIAKRSLYLGRGPDKSLCLYVYEQEKAGFRDGLPDMAKEYASLFKVDNLMRDKS